MKIFHIALEKDWREARRSGHYTTSTLGRSLADEGFIHASREDQVAQVSDTYYRRVRRPLVRLEIETDKLTPEWREDPADGDTYPHIYGPLNVDAVTAVRPWHRTGREKQFLEVFVNGALFRIALAVVAMVLALVGSYLGKVVNERHGAWMGALVGLGLGAAIFALAVGRRGA